MADATAARPGPARAAYVARWLALAGACLAVAYLVLLWVDAAPRGHLHTGDTDLLIGGARKAADCIHLGVWRACDRAVPDGRSVTPFPLLQYLPIFVMIKLGLSDGTILHVLGRINLVAFAAVMLLAVATLRTRGPRAGRWLGALAVAALLGSSATYQATAGFGEMLAACAVLAAVSAAAYRRPLLVAAAVAIAALGKETLFPFIVVLCVVAARRDEELLPPARVLVPIGAGALAGVVVNSLFNEFRFGTVRNGAYLDPLTRTRGLSRQVEFAFGGWLSPTSGIAWFWPAATVLLLAVVGVSLAALARRRPWRTWLPPLVAVATATALVGGLALWFSPFGWIAYGPRLAVPILPAVLVVALLTAAPTLAGAVRAVVRRRSGRLRMVPIVAAAALLAALGWPQYGAPWSWRPAVLQLVAPDSACDSILHVTIQQDVPHYFHCASHVMWRLHPATLDDAALRGNGAVAAGRLLAALATLALVAAALSALGAAPAADVAAPEQRRERRCRPACGPAPRTPAHRTARR